VRHARSGDLFLVANTHTVVGQKTHAIRGSTQAKITCFKEMCMHSVMEHCMALAAAQGQCHVVIAGDWNIEASSVDKVMQERPTGEDWWSVGDRRDFIVSTCGSWQVKADVVSHDKMHKAVLAQLQPTPEPVKLTPFWDNLNERVKLMSRHLVERLRKRAAKRGRDAASLATEAMDEELARQREDDKARSELRALKRQRKVEAEHVESMQKIKDRKRQRKEQDADREEAPKRRRADDGGIQHPATANDLHQACC